MLTTPSQSGPSPLFRALRVSSVGLEMGVAIAIGWGIGYWLDRRLDSAPWMMLSFLLIGVAAGFKGLLRTARQMQRDAQTHAPMQPEASARRDPARPGSTSPESPGDRPESKA